jgi:GNAT superfamily N-acetyltransferase
MVVEIHEAVPDDWDEFRRMRLGSLRESPDAFRRVLGDEEEAPAENWRPFLERIADDANAGVFLARVDGEAVGLSFVGYDVAAGTSSFGGMWVHPESRRTGAGEALLEAGIEWGLRHGAARTRLAVAIGNGPAEQLYARAGFSATGETEPLREGTDLTIAWLERRT